MFNRKHLVKRGLNALINVQFQLSIRKVNHSHQKLPKKFPIAGVQNIILVASGKGGVGKSTVASNLSIALSKRFTVGLLDADVFGPSIPIMMNLSAMPEVNHKNLIKPVINYNVKCMSMGLLIDEKSPVVWRGLMVMQAIKKLLRGVVWGPLDILVIDMPPGTGDTQLSIAQETPIQGVLMVSTPQKVAVADCVKGVEMFKKVDIPIVGVVENMSYFICTKCNTHHHIFRDNLGSQRSLLDCAIVGRLPFKPKISTDCDEGIPSVLTDPDISDIFEGIVDSICPILKWDGS